MILEALLYATARASPDLRRRGLVGDAVALWSRRTRRRRAWAPHERRCHAFVTEVVAGLASRRTALVLGSGLIRDVPLDTLVASFDRVVLLDAVHLLPARWRARSERCELIVADLTARDALDRFRADPTLDLVVSANVLSQLSMSLRRGTARGSPAGDPSLPRPHAEVLARGEPRSTHDRPAPFEAGLWSAPQDEEHGGPEKASRPAFDRPESLVRDFAVRHFADLAAFRAPVCLLTDVAYRDVDRDGVISPETALVPDDLLPPADATWEWEVAPRGEISRRFARVHRVHASYRIGRVAIATASDGVGKGSA